jgi:hypothetical protein
VDQYFSSAYLLLTYLLKLTRNKNGQKPSRKLVTSINRSKFRDIRFFYSKFVCISPCMLHVSPTTPLFIYQLNLLRPSLRNCLQPLVTSSLSGPTPYSNTFNPCPCPPVFQFLLFGHRTKTMNNSKQSPNVTSPLFIPGCNSDLFPFQIYHMP